MKLIGASILIGAALIAGSIAWANRLALISSTGGIILLDRMTGEFIMCHNVGGGSVQTARFSCDKKPGL